VVGFEPNLPYFEPLLGLPEVWALR